MLYISLDVETSGLNPETCDVLEIGAYIEDTDTQLPRAQLPCWHHYIWHDNYQGEPFALAMNAHILTKILELKKITNLNYWNDTQRPLLMPEQVWDSYGHWLYSNRKLWAGSAFDHPTLCLDTLPRLVVAGKNVAGFDIPFLKQIKGIFPPFHHRVIDPGMLYFNPLTDELPPDLKECKKRAGLPEIVTHEALDDAWDVIQLVRTKFPRV